MSFAMGRMADIEMPFRALPEHELRIADVAYLSAVRNSEFDAADYICGAPDLVVEVLSPSNTASELLDKESLCLENGAKEFWVVDPIRRQAKVSTVGGRTQTWKSGQEIPLPLFGAGARLSVDAIFGSTAL